MKSEFIDQMVQEILTDMYSKEKDTATKPETTAFAFPEDAIEEFIQEDDEIGKNVMRKIWRELIETQHAGRMK
jgi:CRP-like cAMP-binding protein